MVIIEFHPAGEEVVDIDDIHHVSSAKFAGMGHLYFTVDSVPRQNDRLDFFHNHPCKCSMERGAQSME